MKLVLINSEPILAILTWSLLPILVCMSTTSSYSKIWAALLFCSVLRVDGSDLKVADEIDQILQETKKEARNPRIGWKKAAIQTAILLDTRDPKSVTAALYRNLKREGSDGVMRAIVSRVSHTAKNAFAPDAWLDFVSHEEDPMIKTHGLMIFDGTDHKSSKRFKSMLKEALKDARIGTSVYGEGRAYSNVGERVCDEAYNMLMEDRPDRPPEHPLDVSGDDLSTRNRLIMKLCAELGVSGPLSPDAILPKATNAKPEASKNVSPAPRTSGTQRAPL